MEVWAMKESLLNRPGTIQARLTLPQKLALIIW